MLAETRDIKKKSKRVQKYILLRKRKVSLKSVEGFMTKETNVPEIVK